MKNKAMFTKIIMLVVFILIVAIDIILATNKTSGDTISEVTLFYSLRLALIPWSCGYLMGHLFTTFKVSHDIPAWGSIFIGLVFGIFFSFLTVRLQLNIMPIIWVFLGAPAGAYFWAQRRK
jgi:hypothetical protein